MQKAKTAVTLGQDAGLAGFLKVANEAPVLSAEEEVKLARQYRDEEDVGAARALVLSNLRHVVQVAKKFTGYGLPAADLVQEGNIGLMKAVKNFDPEKGIRLVSYAVHWIRAEIYEFVLKNWKIVKVATTKAQRKLFFNIRKARKSLNTMTEAETQALAKNLDVSPKDVREMEKRMSSPDVAFDGPDTGDEFVSSPSGYLPDLRYNPEALTISSQTSRIDAKNLSVAIEKLDERSRDIVQQRWLSEKKSTLHDLADKYGISAERIRQIEKRAMGTMREAIAELG